MRYEAPTLTRYGNIASLTASDIKCSAGDDLGHAVRFAHPNEDPWTHWTAPNGDKATPRQLLTSGHCEWVSILNARSS